METPIQKYVQGIKAQDLEMTIQAIAELDVEATVAHWTGGGALAYLVLTERMAEAGSFDEVYLARVISALIEKNANLHRMNKPYGEDRGWFLLSLSTLPMSKLLLRAGADPRFEDGEWISAYTISQYEDTGKFELFQRHIAALEANQLRETTLGVVTKQHSATVRKRL